VAGTSRFYRFLRACCSGLLVRVAQDLTDPETCLSIASVNRELSAGHTALRNGIIFVRRVSDGEITINIH
jgi:hypothetical protein